MEVEKDFALKQSKGDFDAHSKIVNVLQECMRWWIKNVETAYKPISHGPPQRRMETDSSTNGYGGHDVTNNLEISGMWDDDEKKYT